MTPSTVLAFDQAHQEHEYRDDTWWQAPNTPRDNFISTLLAQDCIFCHVALKVESVHEIGHHGLEVGSCVKCGWWRILRRYAAADASDLSFMVADAKHYDISDGDVPIAELRNFLARHPSNLAHVSPTALERLIQDCLRDEFAPCEVIHVGRTGDGGIDLKLVHSDREPVLIQVKRRADLSQAEGVRVVRELNGVLFREGLARGMVVTTASRYTRGAHHEASEVLTAAATNRYQVQLRAFSDVLAMLGLTRRTGKLPWLDYLAEFRHLGGGIDASVDRFLRDNERQSGSPS
jgi:hypothetical protein